LDRGTAKKNNKQYPYYTQLLIVPDFRESG
jgi:hypothetical protein